MGRPTTTSRRSGAGRPPHHTGTRRSALRVIFGAMLATPAVCLNCAAQLGGPFCSECGQRAVAPYPTTRELAGDAWQELSGWDGRFVRTFRILIRYPGVLTIEALEGRR